MEEIVLNFQSSDFDIVDKKKICIDFKKIENKKLSRIRGFPMTSVVILMLIVISCLCWNVISNYDPKYMDLINCNIAPNKIFYFGTDSMGRDIFSGIWYGGKISLFIGTFSTIISTFIGVLYGSISGMSSKYIDYIMMEAIEIIISIPSILLVIFVQAIVGKNNVLGISVVIGTVSWMNIAKVVRSEVKQISSIMFMIVNNIANAIAIEATLSFLGIGLPVEIISWGSMLSLAQQALLSNYWWIVVIPGVFLVITIFCLSNIGDYLRRKNIKKHNNL